MTHGSVRRAAKLYLSLDIQLSYDHEAKLVTATAGAACV
jgi:hypothetical protein